MRERDDGVRPEGSHGLCDPDGAVRHADQPRKGLERAKPWHDFANTGRDADGTLW